MAATISRRQRRAWNRAPAGQARIRSLQEEMRREVRRRVDRLIALIRESIAENNALNLRLNADPRRDFGDDNATRHETYSEWVTQAIRDAILAEMSRQAIQEGRHYTATWIRTAYRRGIKFAQDQLESANATQGAVGGVGTSGALMDVNHSDNLQMRYGRSYAELEGIADGMGQSSSRTVANILDVSARVDPEDAADDLVEPIESAYQQRLRPFVRYETMEAFTAAMFTEYEKAGVEDIVGYARYATAGDSHVCPQCAPFHGQKMPISRARELLPQHPGCRCVAAIWVENYS